MRALKSAMAGVVVATLSGVGAWMLPRLAAAQDLASVILAQGPAAYWRFDEASGTIAYDASGNGHHGRYVGSVTRGVPGADQSSSNTAFGVNGSGYMEATGVPIRRSFSMVVWARSNPSTWNTNGWIASARVPNGFIIHPSEGNRNVPTYVINNVSGLGYSLVGNPTVSELRTWHHYALVYDEVTQVASTYIDGVLVAASSYGAGNRSATGSVNIWFGRDMCCGDRYGSGAIDEAALYHRALSASEVSAQYAAATAVADTDQDGVPDHLDAYPCDPAASAVGFAPARGDHGMLLFEDEWPQASDLDFNDVVLTYNYAYRLTADGRVASMRATYNLLALGGSYSNGLGLHLPVPRAAVSSVTRSIDGGAPAALSPSLADAELTVTVSPDLRELFGGQQGQINSRTDEARRTGQVVEVEITFAAPVILPLGQAPYDVYVFRASDPRHEIHRPEFGGTSQMNTALFGTGLDDSTPGRRFVDGQGLPFGLHLPTRTTYPREGAPISSLWPRILTFAASAGASDQDFYSSEVVQSARYLDVGGAPAPASTFPTADQIPADLSCL